CDSKDGLSLFDLTSGASTAPAADADSAVRSQWLTSDAAARLGVRSHLPSTERAHFSQYKSAKTLYDAVVARYSSPATAALSRLMLPYLFPDLAAFTTVTDLITHLRTSDTRYRAALPAEFCAKNPPPMYIALYYLVTRLPDTLRSEPLVVTSVPLSLRGAPPFLFCPPLPLLLLSTLLAPSRSALRLLLARGTATARASGARALEEVTGEEVVAVEAEEGVGVGVEAEVGASVAAVEVEAAVAVAVGVEAAEAAAAEVELVEAELSSGDPSTSRALVRPRRHSSFVSGTQGVRGLGRCFGRLTDAWRTQFPDATEIPRWGDLLKWGVAIFDLDFDAILAAMYAVSISAEGDCYVCVPPDPGIEAAALGASESAAPGASESVALGASESAAPGTRASALSGAASAPVLHTFTLDSGASRFFFRDRTTLTPLSRPVAVSLADPSGGPVLAHYSTVLPCPAAPSGFLSGLYLPSFSTNLVSGADLQDGGVDQFTPASQRVTHCMCARTGRHLATFTRRLGSSLYTLTTESPPVAVSGQVAASSQVFAAASRSGPESAPCSCRLLSHQTLLWHHRLGHPSLPRLRGMASRVLVSGLPRSLPPLPLGPAPTCIPCVEGRQRAAPHSSDFPPTEAPLQTLHMDVWGPARVRGQGHERYFLLVVDDYSRYTTVLLLRSKGEVTEVLIDWIRVDRLQLRERFGSDFPVLRLHSDRGGEFSCDLLRAFCRAEGIRQTFTLPASPQQNGITERRIGMVMDVARTSMIHAAAPHFLWPFAVQYAAHQLNLQPRVSMPETSPTLRWTRKVGDASAFHAVEPVEVAVDSGTSGGAEPACEEPGGAGSGGAEPKRAEPGGAGSGGAEPRVAESGGAEPAGAGLGGPSGALSRRELPSPQELREWFARRWSRAAGAGGTAGAGGSASAGGAGATSPVDARTGGTGAVGRGGATGAGATGAAGAGGAAGVGSTGGTRAGAAESSGAAGGTGAGGAAGAGAPVSAGVDATGAAGGTARAGGTAGVGADAAGAVSAGSGGATWPRPYFFPLLVQVLGLSPSSGPASSLECPLLVQSESQLQLASPLPAPSPNAGPTGGLAERREPESRPASPVRTARTSRHVPRQCPPAVPSMHKMALRPSTASQRVPLPSPPASSLPALADPESDSLCAASPTVTRFLATAVTDPSFESATASALVAELVDFTITLTRDKARRTITLTQSHMVQQVLQRFDFTYSSPQATPLSTRHSLSAVLSDESVEPSGPYPELVGCLMYLMTCTQPDLAYPLSILACYVAPGRHQPEHMAAAKRVLRYLCSTSGMGLVLGGRSPVVLTGHADASWVDNPATQRSSQGYTFSLGFRSVSWRSIRSSSLTYLLTDLGEPPRSPPVLYVDNKAMLALCREHRLEHRMKHIALRYFLARELQQRGQLCLAYMASQANTAHIFVIV
ncbi:unnamed protein product, partial [Closterium sp. NIES-53]